LSTAVVDIESLLDKIDDWLQYFPQAKPHSRGGNVYAVMLLGLCSPFTAFIKKLSLWCKEKKFSL